MMRANLRPEMIESARGGDSQAILAVLAAAQPDIRRYAQATCKAADIDDAVQDALVRVHRHIGQLRVVAAFSGWVFAVVQRECIRLARRPMAGTPIESVEDDLRFASRPQIELRIDLGAAIEALPEHYRDVIVLRDIEELTIDEIAARLDATRETIKARLHRARGLVREYLVR